ncbi:uncharacterized protein E0L32_005196 [Thyridium curvatum]|uniref:Uncharacterized protein n=1 Tax=Thyridium curvatum TaxID=1093900 RepID=A0A507BCW0_9PEZI|nr:uncharacterized protein E0L32_005196 [Thyridium curvatum]TPX14801.1 hypothetical protein E0L32_005196 [Thyridium curvatum]
MGSSLEKESKISKTSVLTEAEKEQFIQHGWVKIEGAFTEEQAAWVTQDVWTRLGMAPDNKSTWNQERVHMPGHRTFDCAKLAPRAWAAICEICGGEDKVRPESRYWQDSLIVNLGTVENEGKPVPPQQLYGWHVDGDFFVHYLDSAEQGLLVIPLFTDIVPDGGGTVICPEAMPKVAAWLHDHPEGVNPRMIPRGEPGFEKEGPTDWFNSMARSCTNFVEAGGKCGDVYLLHPLMLHSASTNPLRRKGQTLYSGGARNVKSPRKGKPTKLEDHCAKGDGGTRESAQAGENEGGRTGTSAKGYSGHRCMRT